MKGVIASPSSFVLRLSGCLQSRKSQPSLLGGALGRRLYLQLVV